MDPHDALDDDEAEILAAYEKDEIKPDNASKADLEKYRLAASATFAKEKRVNIRLTAPDFMDIQVRARQEGMTHQTLIASVLHKYLTGHFSERPQRHIGALA